jgi:hypothetical protein
MMFAVAALCCTLTIAAAEEGAPHSGYAPRPVIDARAFFTGNTLSAVAFIPREEDEQEADSPTSGALLRVMFQAYLRPDGGALVRAWDPRVGRYTPVASERWQLEGSALCLRVPFFNEPGPMCFDVHLWGRNFAGHGINANGMIKGDVKPGNVLAK